MGIRTTGLQALAWMALLGTAGGVPNNPDGDQGNSESPEIEQGQPIHSGVVLLDGRYLPLPYVVGHREDEVYINGHPVPAESLRGGRTGRRRARGRGEGARQRNAAAAGVERRLMSNSLLIEWESAVIGFIPFEQGFPILDVLLSDGTKEAKVQALMESDMAGISSAQWERLVEDFQPNAELSERVLAFAAETDLLLQQHEAAHQKAVSSAPLSPGLTYGINLTGILLAIFALGSLLTHRPRPDVRWREIDATDGGPPLVVRNIALIVLLGLFDLACTLIAERSGGFWEINPLAAQLIQSPAALVAFKIPLLVGSAAILLSLRRYHGAQIASWWLCLVCTVLTFRWATYNSMFLS
jgi:hypothetical protein